MVSISYHDTVKFLQGTISKVPSPFARAEWLELLANGEEGVVIAAANSGEKQTVLPLLRRFGRLESLANWYNFTWEPLGLEHSSLLEALALDLKSKTHRLTLSPLADEAGQASAIETAFRRTGWSVYREHCDNNHTLSVKGRSFAEYWAARPGQIRSTLKRKAKKVDVTILSHFDPAAWSDYEAIYQSSWKPREAGSASLRKFAEQEGAAGRIRLAVARQGGVAVAAQFWTVEAGTAYIHKLAHLEETKQLSAGTTLSAALFEHVIDRDKVDMVDFGTGNDPFKLDWMEDIRPRFRLDCLDPRQPKAWPALGKRRFLRLAQVARQS